ncbi:hypothetical protein [uncultured Rikenella sp.]|uniref:hypothetical protein n=1 Tax=uncultured Rikenella sp. TaxID=368003 RepID=UPI00261AEA5E|nr:hypothetical protein [uncultured Rikenella sp.]
MDDFLLQLSRTDQALFMRRDTSTVARWDFISILLTAKRAKSLFTRAGDCRVLSWTEPYLF